MSNAPRAFHAFPARGPEWRSERVGAPVTSAWSARARGDGLCRALTREELQTIDMDPTLSEREVRV